MLLAGAVIDYAYQAEVTEMRVTTENTARLMPHLDDVAVLLEELYLQWQR
jgi:hypothetical protein